MTAAHLVSAAVTAGAWVLIPAALLTAAWATVRTCTWAWRLAAAAVQWRHDTRAEPAVWTADNRSGLHRLRDAIKQQQRKEDR